MTSGLASVSPSVTSKSRKDKTHPGHITGLEWEGERIEIFCCVTSWPHGQRWCRWSNISLKLSSSCPNELTRSITGGESSWILAGVHYSGLGQEFGDLTLRPGHSSNHCDCYDARASLESWNPLKIVKPKMKSVLCVNFNFAILLQSIRLKRTHWDSLGVLRECLLLPGSCGVNIQLALKRDGDYLSICPRLWLNLDSFSEPSV